MRMGNKDNIRNVFAGLNRPFGKDGSEEVVRGGLVDALEDKGACGLPEWQLYQREFAKKHAIVEQLLDMRHAHFMEPRNLVVLERMEALCDPVSETIQEGLGWSLPRVRVWWGDACTPSGGEGVVFAPWRCAHGLGFVQELRARCARIKINAGLLSLCWKVPDAAFLGKTRMRTTARACGRT